MQRRADLATGAVRRYDELRGSVPEFAGLAVNVPVLVPDGP